MWLLLLFADAPAADPNPWTALGGGIVGAASGTGFAIWIAWYLITRVLPTREAAFATDRELAEKRSAEKFEAQEKRHADHLGTERIENREDMREAWKVNRETSEKFINALEKITDRIEASCKYKG